ncbi:MAG: hypothetical protein ACP5PZ_06340 [Bacteroidales bacterium]
MMKKYSLLVLVFLFILQNGHAQHSIKLRVTDIQTDEALVGGVIVNTRNQNTYLTNAFGYSLIPFLTKNDTLQLHISYVGYSDTLVMVPYSDTVQVIALNPLPTQIEEVYVQGYHKTPHHGQLQLSAMELKRLPVIFAERDVLKSIQTLPGVQQNREGTSNFSVRGEILTKI